jgi:hypothetical protein
MRRTIAVSNVVGETLVNMARSIGLGSNKSLDAVVIIPDGETTARVVFRVFEYHTMLLETKFVRTAIEKYNSLS